MKFFYRKKKICGLFAIFIVIMLSFQIVTATTINDSVNVNTHENPKISAQISGIEYDWLNNSGFVTDEYWESEIATDPSNPDVNATISNDLANFEIIGDTYTYSSINGTPTTAGGWFKSTNSDYPAEPNQASTLTSEGAYARHHWSESADQQVVVQWDKLIEMPHNMSDYVVTAASLNMTVNATVHADPGYTSGNTWGGLEISASESNGGTQYNIGDFIRFFISLSDKDKKKNYTDVISYQTSGLGTDQGGGGDNYDYLDNTVVEVDDENDLIFILNNLFQNYNNTYLNITIGMFLNCEDNWSSDDDFFEAIYIKSVNLSFTYKKKIDQFTYVSWKQVGNKISVLSPENYNVIATSANLKFKYTIDKNWTTLTGSYNSEINTYLNGNPYPIPIKIIDINMTDYEEAEIELTPPVDSVNISIQVLIKDDFGLDQIITISIDNVTLDIGYIIFAPDPVSGGGGGGGGTKYIRGPDYTPVIIGLIAGIIALVTFFGAYQTHYKYPPMVRKIRKLRKKIRKGKSIKSLLVNTRENLAKASFQKDLRILKEEKVPIKKMAQIDKNSKLSNDKKIKGGAK